MDKNIDFKGTRHIQVKGRVSTAGVFLKGAWCSVFRSQGSLSCPNPEQIVSEMKGVRPDPERVRLYRAVCGFPSGSGELPLAFPETLFLPPLGCLVTSDCFPLSPAGLIHVGQKIIHYGPLGEDTTFDLVCRMSRMSHTGKGISLDVAMEARAGEELVWEGTASFLSRSKAVQKGGKRRENISSEAPPEPDCIIEVPEDTGRLYAKASGDYNPHHLYRVTARPLGYRRPIAHGMWSLSRSLAEITKEIPVKFPFSADAEFKLPVYMPAKTALNWKQEGKEGRITFTMTDARTGLPHLKGAIC